MVVLRLVDNFKGMDIKWRKKGNVSCGNVVSIREKDVNVEGTNTLEESQNVVRIKCRRMRMREWIRTDMKVIQNIQYKGKSDTETHILMV